MLKVWFPVPTTGTTPKDDVWCPGHPREQRNISQTDDDCVGKMKPWVPKLTAVRFYAWKKKIERGGKSRFQKKTAPFWHGLDSL
jgi:hypothetical protein